MCVQLLPRRCAAGHLRSIKQDVYGQMAAKKKKKKELEQTSMNSWSVHSADLKLPKSFDVSDNP